LALGWRASTSVGALGTGSRTTSTEHELAIDDGLLSRNPCRKVKLPKLKTPPQPDLTVEELYRLADQLSPRYGAMVLVGGLAGLRFSQVAARVSDVDLNSRTITVRHQLDRTGTFTPTKTDGSVASLRVARAAVEALERHIEKFGIGPNDL
jgi:integrase